MDDLRFTSRATSLLVLHAGPGFIIPNAWDAGSARILEQVGFPAIATTSAGIAWACGVPDGEALEPDTMFERVAEIVAAVGVPVSADLEAGYGDSAGRGRPHRCAGRGTRRRRGEHRGRRRTAVCSASTRRSDRLVAARAAAPTGTFVLNARTDTYFGGIDRGPVRRDRRAGAPLRRGRRGLHLRAGGGRRRDHPAPGGRDPRTPQHRRGARLERHPCAHAVRARGVSG